MECPNCNTPLPEGGICPTCQPAGEVAQSSVPVWLAELEKARELYAAGQVNEAIAICVTIMNTAADDPATSHVYEFLGDIFREQHDVPKALESYRRAVALKPSDENRQKYDEMIDLSRGMAPKRTLSPSPMTAPPALPVANEGQTAVFNAGETATVRPPEAMDTGGGDGFWTPVRAIFLLVIAIVVIGASVLLSMQPWHHAAKPTAHKMAIPVFRKERKPIPPGLVPPSGSGFSSLSDKPPSVETPVGSNK